ncbi:helix-turn-helix domain-containing protein [Chloroflexi bacterium TSY]|nr:helix-turn-helix domain-containing protein [Chloroflexi bacterium TSY]
MSSDHLPARFLEKLEQVTGKRSRIVIDHILEHGFITTEELEQIYGYKHPPRAVKDVRDQGIPIETYSVKSSDGRIIAAYRFGDPSEVREGRLGGRTAFSRRFKKVLYD